MTQHEQESKKRSAEDRTARFRLAQIEERIRCDRANIDAVTPYMKDDPTMTVREALEKMAAQEKMAAK